MTDFQASAGIEGRQFAEQCSQLLTHYGYTLHGRALIGNVGVEIDCVATSPAGNADPVRIQGQCSRYAEVDPLVVELRDGLLMDHTVTL